MMISERILTVRNLRVEFPTRHGPMEAVNDVSFEIDRGETVAIVGESGSGKSVSARSIIRLLQQGRVEGGSVEFKGEELTTKSEKEIRPIRSNQIAMIFQDPMTALDPLFTIRNQVAETLRIHRPLSRRVANRRAVELLREVGIPDAEKRATAYPHQLSGGQRQRVMIAIALACSPELLIADEPTTALDVTVEAEILRLIRNLQLEYGTALLLITHDMGVVSEMADRVVVMYAGQVMEEGMVGEVLKHPQNPYTEALLASIPRPTIKRSETLPVIRGVVPSLFAMPSGCRFNPRCQYAWDRCRMEEPPLFETGGRRSRCWLQEDGATEVTVHTSRDYGWTTDEEFKG